MWKSYKCNDINFFFLDWHVAANIRQEAHGRRAGFTHLYFPAGTRWQELVFVIPSKLALLGLVQCKTGKGRDDPDRRIGRSVARHSSLPDDFRFLASWLLLLRHSRTRHVLTSFLQESHGRR